MKPLGLILLFGGASAFLAISSLTWYDHPAGETYPAFNENAWDGAWSAAAACGAAAALVFGCISLRMPIPVLRWLALLGALAALVCSAVYFGENSGDIIIFGKTIPSRMHRDTVYAAIAAGAVCTVGGVINALKFRKV